MNENNTFLFMIFIVAVTFIFSSLIWRSCVVTDRCLEECDGKIECVELCKTPPIGIGKKK